ncbi:hypothetical protein Q9966_016776 [Columba livia]|nr:hypothetical protein Q9966_016776 [Columba livia]
MSERLDDTEPYFIGIFCFEAGDQDHRAGLRLPQGLLPAQRLERHGLRGGAHRDQRTGAHACGTCVSVHHPGHRGLPVRPAHPAGRARAAAPQAGLGDPEPAGGAQVHHEGDDPAAADRAAALLRHPHLRHHRPRVLHGQVPHHLLRPGHRRDQGGGSVRDGRAGPDLPQRHQVQEVLGGAQLRHHAVRQHPVRRAHGLPVHHHGGLDRPALLQQRRLREHLELALLHPPHHHRLLFYAEPRAGGAVRGVCQRAGARGEPARVPEAAAPAADRAGAQRIHGVDLQGGRSDPGGGRERGRAAAPLRCSPEGDGQEEQDGAAEPRGRRGAAGGHRLRGVPVRARQPQERPAGGRHVPAAARAAAALPHPARREDSGVLLDRAGAGGAQHALRRHRALRPAGLAFRLPLLCRIHFLGTLYVRNVYKDVRAGHAALFPLLLQLLRLRRDHREHLRGDLGGAEAGHVVRDQRPARAAPAAHLQGHQVLGFPAEPGGFPAQLHEVHHQPPLPPLPLHRRLRPFGDAAFWGTVQL